MRDLLTISERCVMQNAYDIDIYRRANIICVDIETKDPELLSKGPGVYRRDGYIIGVGLATKEYSHYYNFAHPDGTDAEKAHNMQFVADVLALDVPKIGANLLYDLDWLENYQGMRVNGQLHDVQIAEALLDPYARYYNLNSLANKYLKQGKDERRVIAWCNDNCLQVSKNRPVQTYFYRMPSWIMQDYVTGDIEQPLKIFVKQWSKLRDAGMLGIYDMECALLRPLLIMRKNGVRLDMMYMQEKKKLLETGIHELTKELYYNDLGYPINLNATADLVKVCEARGIKTGLTDKGNKSVGKSVFEHTDDPVLKKIHRIRKYEKALSTFFVGAFEKLNVDGRIHCGFHPLRSEAGGAATGRFSSSLPNLQNIPVRDKELGEMCRSCFIPEEGMLWGKLDLSQIQYRAIAHYARGQKSDYIRKRYNENPRTDYHEEIMQMSGITERKLAKNLNFGLAFNMGAATAADFFGWDIEFAENIFSLYHEKVPFITYTSKLVERKARSVGYVTTVSGRRLNCPAGNNAYKLFNYLMQGTEADAMKYALVAAYKAGIFDTLRIHLTVHDEYDFSIPRTNEGAEAVKEFKHVMENSIKLEVPIIAELETGENWHNLKKTEEIKF